MSQLTKNLQKRFFDPQDHPYQHFVSEIPARATRGCTVLEAGCGRDVEVLTSLCDVAGRRIGIDLVSFSRASDGKWLVEGDLSAIPLAEQSVDLVISRSVLEHVRNPSQVYREIGRVLRPNGYFVFLTPDLWDYASLCSKVIPNRLHPAIVRKCEGRAEQDTFPVVYKSNTARSIRKLAGNAHFDFVNIRYLGQYPCYLMFNPLAFLIGTAYEKIISRWALFSALRGWLLVTLRKRAQA